jgi:CRP-like cAMP-binding protein
MIRQQIIPPPPALRARFRAARDSTSRGKTAIASNRLLTALPDKDRRRILARCDQVELASGDILHEAGARLRHVYFPTGGYISLVTPLNACAGLEVALVGNEGMAGISPVLGVSVSQLNYLVQGSGSALRISAASFRRELARSPALRHRLNLYVYVKMQQMAQIVACTRFHMVEPRLARLLLMTHDRSPADEFHATHEFLAYMLGVRRVGITKVATSLQKQSLIRYGRGNITILNRRGLEAKSCGCYEAANELYDRVLGSAA